MRRSFGLLACLFFEWSAAHPGCYPDDFPDASKTASIFCPAEQFGGGSFIQYGSCCTDEDEDDLAVVFDAAVTAAGGELSLECAELHKEVVCTPCHSYAGHLYENGGILTMKREFCDAYTAACAGEILFDADYCEVQVGSASGPDAFWSYPFFQEVFTDGFAEVFPNASLPERAFSVQQSPDGSMYFVAGHLGEMKKIMASDLDPDLDLNPVPSSALMTLTDADPINMFPTSGSQTDEGLTHFAFSPNFAVNNYFYVSFTVMLPGESETRCRLAKFTYDPSTGTASPGSQEILLQTALKISPYHPGGWVGFKPAAYADPTADYHDIYWSTGDGSQQEDRENLAQDLNNLLGAMLRIQVPSGAGTSGSLDAAGNYGALNPGVDVDPAVCAIGFRNPWRCSFSPDGDLYCGDVGQYKVEEISFVECGNNYGWTLFEGSRCHSSAVDPINNNGLPQCETGDAFRADYTFPWFEYCHDLYFTFLGFGTADEAIYTNNLGQAGVCGSPPFIGSAVIGGYWYNGEIFSDLLGGAYVFGDHTNQNIYYLTDDGQTLGTIISDNSIQVVSFAEDINGELMVLDVSGNIFYLPCGDLCPPISICPEGGLTFEGELMVAQGASCLLEGTTFTFPASAIGSLPTGGYSVSTVSDGVNTPVAPDGSGDIFIVLIPDVGTTLTVSLTGGGEDTDCNTVTVLPMCDDIVDDPCAEPSPCGPDETCAPAAEPIPAGADPYVCTPIGDDPCAEPSPCGPDETCAPAEEPVPAGADPYVCTPIEDPCAEPSPCGPDETCAPAEEPVPEGADPYVCTPIGPDGPFNGVPADVPGTIEAEEFDNGGPGVAYSDGDPNNIGGALRTTEEVDIGSIAGGGFFVGWTQAGEWMRYTVEVTEDVNPITFSFNVASPFTDLGKLRVVTGGTDCDDYTTDLSGEVVLPSTGGWNAFEDYTITGEQPLSAGETEIWLCIISPGFNIDSWTVSPTT